MTKVGPRLKGPSRRELRQLSRNSPASGLPAAVSSSSLVAIQQQPTPPISGSGPRSSNSIYLDVSKLRSRRLLPRSKKAGGRHKPILVAQHSVNSPPRLRRISLTSAHKWKRSPEMSTETDELLKAFQARVQRTALDIKEKRAELISLRLQAKPKSPVKANIFSLTTPRTTPPDAPVFAPPRPVQPNQSTPVQMLPTPDDTPLASTELTPPVAACPPRASTAFDDPFVSGASPPATMSPYLKALNTASPGLRASRVQRPHDVGSRIPRPMSLTAIPLHVVESPPRVPDTPVPSGADTPKVLGHTNDKSPDSQLLPILSVSTSQDSSCDNAQAIGSPDAGSDEKVIKHTDSKQMASPMSLSSPGLNAATVSARPVRPAQASEKRKSCPPRAGTRPTVDRSTTIAPARQISRASSLRIVPPVSSQLRPTRVTSSYYQKENHRKPEVANAGKAKSSAPTCRSPQTAPAALEKNRVQPFKRTSSVTSSRPVREGRAPAGPPPKGPAAKRVSVRPSTAVSQGPTSNPARTARPVERTRSTRSTQAAPAFPAPSPAAIVNVAPASVLATSSSGSIFPLMDKDVDLEAGDTAIEMQRQGVATGLPSDGDAGVAHTPRKSTGLRGFARMVGDALSSPFKPTKASAPTRVWR